MSNDESASLQYWAPFFDKVTEELDSLNERLKGVCEEYGKEPRCEYAKSARVFAQRRPVGARKSPENSKGKRAVSRRPKATPSIRRNVDPNIDYPVITDYKNFPIRTNASARIYRPHRLECPVYKNEKRIVPVLFGETVKINRNTT